MVSDVYLCQYSSLCCGVEVMEVSLACQIREGLKDVTSCRGGNTIVRSLRATA